MKVKFLGLTLALATAFGVVSCKDDLSIDSNDQSSSIVDNGQSLYMSLGVNFFDNAKSTRSTTNTGDGDDYASSSDGMEYSSLDEYDVRTAIIVLAKMGSYDYLAHADVTGILTADRNTDANAEIKPENYFSFSTIGRFKYSDIAALYDDNGDLKQDYANGVNVFVFCNPTGDLLNRFETTDFTSGTNATDWVNWTGLVEQEPSLPGYTPAITNSIWAPRSFLMSNAKAAFAELPAKLSNWDFYSQDDPFDLSGENLADLNDPDNSEKGAQISGKNRGPVYVERSVARLDLKPDYNHLKYVPQNAAWLKEPGAEWRYSILGGLSSSMHDGTVDTGAGDGTSFNFIDVGLTRISLVNMSKHFHFLRRVSDNGLDNNSTLMGVERSKNYVVDTDADIKRAYQGYNYTNASTGFNFPLFTDKANSNNPDLSREYAYDRYGWFTDNIADIMANDKFDNTGATGNDRYHIWRYFTENTIPQDDAGGNSRQVVVQSTGVVLKGLILPGEDIDRKFQYQELMSHSDDPAAFASNEIRYIPEEVVNALLASKYHLPKYGDGANESKKEIWNPAPGTSKLEKDAELSDNSKEKYSFDYPTLYVFQGSIYAGFKTVVKQAQLYDGVGGLMYNAVNSTLGYWWVNIDDLKTNAKAEFVFKGADFDPAATEGHWLQLNVETYNKIVNNVGNKEPIYQDIDNPSMVYDADRFSVNINEKIGAFRSLLTSGSDASRFTMYDASFEDTDRGGAGWGYYCYYFWWFKHNDNEIDGRMGPMEFSTVRNNVYKLTVDKISSLGHPLNTLNDPDPLNPETPDEDDRIYIDVNLRVVPWVVRKNSAIF